MEQPCQNYTPPRLSWHVGHPRAGPSSARCFSFPFAATNGYPLRANAVKILPVRLLRHILVWACGLLALAVTVLGVRSFWRCDEAAYCTYAAAPAPSKGIDRRQILGSYRGGLFWLCWDSDLIYDSVDWYSGPRTELIFNSAPTPLLLPYIFSIVPAEWGPRWRWGGFNFSDLNCVSPPLRFRYWKPVVPHWLLFLVLAWPVCRRLRRARILRRRRRNGLCLYCGYDLRASGDICPECGKSVRELTERLDGRRRWRWRVPAAGALVLALVVLSWGVERWWSRDPQALRLQPGMALPAARLPQRVELEAAPGVWMRFALIPSGRFLMGSPPDEAERSDAELQHAVIISKPFYMGQTCVTQEQYQAVMGTNSGYHRGAKLPVYGRLPGDAVDFCRRVSQRTGRKIALPTEAQWEYACRAGTTTPFNTGRTLPRSTAWYGSYFPGNRVGRPFSEIWGSGPVAVGSFPSNAWGLYDMHGNVREWCSDRFGDYPAGEVTDPTGSRDGRGRVMRGGSCSDGPSHCRSAYRECGDRYSCEECGFRVMMSVAGTE